MKNFLKDLLPNRQRQSTNRAIRDLSLAELDAYNRAKIHVAGQIGLHGAIVTIILTRILPNDAITNAMWYMSRGFQEIIPHSSTVFGASSPIPFLREFPTVSWEAATFALIISLSIIAFWKEVGDQGGWSEEIDSLPRLIIQIFKNLFNWDSLKNSPSGMSTDIGAFNYPKLFWAIGAVFITFLDIIWDADYRSVGATNPYDALIISVLYYTMVSEFLLVWSLGRLWAAIQVVLPMLRDRAEVLQLNQNLKFSKHRNIDPATGDPVEFSNASNRGSNSNRGRNDSNSSRNTNRQKMSHSPSQPKGSKYSPKHLPNRSPHVPPHAPVGRNSRPQSSQDQGMFSMQEVIGDTDITEDGDAQRALIQEMLRAGIDVNGN